MISFRRFAGLAAAVVAGLGVATAANAAIIVSNQNNTGYTPTSTDLLQTNFGSVALTGSFSREGEVGEPAVRDGGFGPQGGANANAKLAAATADNTNALVYTLDTATNTGGYNITGVNTYAGWDGARYGQVYDLSFHIVGQPAASFTTPIVVNYQPTALAGNNDTSITITDASGNLASNVDQVQFVFHDAPNVPAGGYQGYRELDVIGTAAPTPEPASLGLLAVGGLSLLARRRRA